MNPVFKALTISLLAVALPALADGRAQLGKFTAGLKGLDGRFQQSVYDPNGRVTEKSSGTRAAVGAAAIPLGIPCSRASN